MAAKLKTLLKNMDKPLLLLLGLILLGNLVVLSSASANVVAGQPYYYLQRQLVWVAIGLPLLGITALFDYRRLPGLARPLYLLLLMLLVAVLFTTAKNNSHRWFDLGFMDFQPSELAKLGLVLVFAVYLTRRKGKMHRFSTLAQSALLLGLPAGLILIEPDLGTALVLGVLFLAMLWLGGLDQKLFLALVLLVVILAAGLFGLLYQATDGFSQKMADDALPHWLPLKSYQATRLIIFINPYMDPLDSGYHIIQSEIAIGSGGLTGKGYGEGTQVQGNFLPYHHTDFIFSVVGEEFGFLGCAALLLLYFLLLLRLIRIGLHARDQLGALIAGGLTTLLAFQIFVNIGMTVGLTPVTGLPLPLLSYGGSSMLTNMLSFGLLFSIQTRGEQNLF